VIDNKKTILIVDDDEDDCVILQESLDTVGLDNNIQYVLGAEEALDFLKDAVVLPSLIILDINMPRMNGIELLSILKSTYPTVPVILYTTNCTDDVVSEGKKLGAIDCIKKGASSVESLRFAKMVFDLTKMNNQ
jgi:DNA-binding NtrC family response regulator